MEATEGGRGATNDPRNDTKSDRDPFDVSMVGRARGGLRLPLQHVGGGTVHNRGQPPTQVSTAMASQMQLRPGPRSVPMPDRIGSPSVKDTDSVASSVAPSAVSVDLESKHPEIVRTGYIVSFTLVILMACLLEGKGNVFALNLSIVTALPLLASTMMLHSYSMGKMRVSLLGALGTTALAGSSISILLSNSTLSLLRHIPGLAALCLFFYLMSTAWRRILSIVCTILIFLCMILSAAIDATLENREVMLITTVMIFSLLFVESNVSVTPGLCKKRDGCIGMV